MMGFNKSEFLKDSESSQEEKYPFKGNISRVDRFFCENILH